MIHQLLEEEVTGTLGPWGMQKQIERKEVRVQADTGRLGFAQAPAHHCRGVGYAKEVKMMTDQV